MREGDIESYLGEPENGCDTVRLSKDVGLNWEVEERKENAKIKIFIAILKGFYSQLLKCLGDIAADCVYAPLKPLIECNGRDYHVIFMAIPVSST